MPKLIPRRIGRQQGIEALHEEGRKRDRQPDDQSKTTQKIHRDPRERDRFVLYPAKTNRTRSNQAARRRQAPRE
jgi:hypothetical protein